MKRIEGKIPGPAAVEATVAATGLDTGSRSDSNAVFQDGQQLHQYGKLLNSPMPGRLDKLTGAESTVRGLPPVSGKKMRSASVSRNLRKSLAWNKAFSTDEGVLDLDELPLVTKTPRKLLELHPRDMPESLGKASPGPLSDRERSFSNANTTEYPERLARSLVKGSIHSDSHPSDAGKSPICKTSSSKVISPAKTPSPYTTKSKSDSTRNIPVRPFVKDDGLKGTGLRNLIAQALNSPRPTAVMRSKSHRVFTSGSSTEVNVNTGKKGVQAGKNGAQAEVSRRKASTSDMLRNGTIVPSAKGSSSLKTVGLLESVYSKAGSFFKKATENPSVNSIKVSPLSSKKKSGLAGSPILSVEKLNPANAAQSTKGYSSGLRLPSRKMGFFDSTRPSSGEQASRLPRRVVGGASDNSNARNTRNGLPPKPQHALPSDCAGQPYPDSNFAEFAPKMEWSGIPSAPHLRPSGKLDRALFPSISAPTLLKKQRRGLFSSASHNAVTTSHPNSTADSDQFHSSICKRRNHSLWNEHPGTFRKIKVGDSDQQLNCVGQREVDSESGVMKLSSYGLSTGHEVELKSGSLGGDKVSRKLVNSSSIASSKPPFDLSPLGRCHLGLLEESVSGCRLLSGVEHISQQTETGSNNPFLNKVNLSKNGFDLGGCQEAARVGMQLSCCPEFEVASASGTSVRFVDWPAQNKILGPQENHAKIVNTGSERRLDNGSRSLLDSEREDSGECSVGERLFEDDILCSLKEKLVSKDSAKVMAWSNDELICYDSRKISDLGEEKSVSAAKCATEEQGQELSTCLHARHQKKEDEESRIDHFPDSPCRLDVAQLGVDNSNFSQATSVMKGHASSIAPFSERPCTRIVSPENNTRHDIHESVRSLIPNAALDCQSSKYPLTVNVGVLNGAHNQTSTTAVRKEGIVEVAFDHSASKFTSGQENSMVSGQAGSLYLHKPKQRKLSSRKKTEQLEANRTAELSFPFSEERLRALEAAIPEILQSKSGAVQHSPPNKIIPNPNPWSPVKRKGKELGPFDCTKKCTNVILGQ